MIVETSALVAIFLGEPGWEALAELIQSEDSLMSSVSWLEANIVIVRRHGQESREDLLFTKQTLGIEIVPMDVEQAEIAIDGFLRFGKGRHPAALNFGDCASYALAKARSEPLLFVGDDFPQTDVESASP